MNWVHFFIDGITSSFGVILAPIMTNFDSNRSTVSWIGSLILGVYHLSGPIVSLLVKRFGLRVVSITGAFVSSIALLLSTLRLCCCTLTYRSITCFSNFWWFHNIKWNHQNKMADSLSNRPFCSNNLMISCRKSRSMI